MSRSGPHPSLADQPRAQRLGERKRGGGASPQMTDVQRSAWEHHLSLYRMEPAKARACESASCRITMQDRHKSEPSLHQRAAAMGGHAHHLEGFLRAG